MSANELLTPLFITTSAGIVVGLVGLVLRYVYKIKCDDMVFCCGLLRFHRNVDDEMELDMREAAKRRVSMNASTLDIIPPARNNV